MITILIPLYNGIEFLQSAVNSVTSQTFDDWEIIIGVNGHPKRSEVFKRADKFKNDKIRIFDFYAMKGKANTLNKMMKFAKYNYIAILDVDDRWLPTKLEKQVDIINTLNYDVIGTKTQYFGRKHEIPDIPTGEIDTSILRTMNPMINSSIVVKKEFAWWNDDYRGLEDYEMWCRISANGAKFYNISEVLTQNRIHKKSFFNGQDQESYRLRIMRTYYKSHPVK